MLNLLLILFITGQNPSEKNVLKQAEHSYAASKLYKHPDKRYLWAKDADRSKSPYWSFFIGEKKIYQGSIPEDWKLVHEGKIKTDDESQKKLLSGKNAEPGDVFILKADSASPLALVYVGKRKIHKNDKNYFDFFIYPYFTQLEYNTFPPRYHKDLIEFYHLKLPNKYFETSDALDETPSGQSSIDHLTGFESGYWFFKPRSGDENLSYFAPWGDFKNSNVKIYRPKTLSDLKINSAFCKNSKTVVLKFIIKEKQLIDYPKVEIFSSNSKLDSGEERKAMNFGTSYWTNSTSQIPGTEKKQSIRMPVLDNAGLDTRSIGDHEVTISFSDQIKGSFKSPYVFIGANLGGSYGEDSFLNNIARLGEITLEKLDQISIKANQIDPKNKYQINSTNKTNLIEPLNQMFGEFGILSPKQQAAFLGQSFLETAIWKSLTEIGGSKAKPAKPAVPASPGKPAQPATPAIPAKSAEQYFFDLYNHRGTIIFPKNLKRNELKKEMISQWYIGRGLFHLTHDFNYKAASFDLLNDENILLNNPTLVATDYLICARTGGWFWTKNHLDKIAETLPDSIDANFLTITKKISKKVNGGENGLNLRIIWTKAAFEVLITPVTQPAPDIS